MWLISRVLIQAGSPRFWWDPHGRGYHGGWNLYAGEKSHRHIRSRESLGSHNLFWEHVLKWTKGLVKGSVLLPKTTTLRTSYQHINPGRTNSNHVQTIPSVSSLLLQVLYEQLTTLQFYRKEKRSFIIWKQKKKIWKVCLWSSSSPFRARFSLRLPEYYEAGYVTAALPLGPHDNPVLSASVTNGVRLHVVRLVKWTNACTSRKLYVMDNNHYPVTWVIFHMMRCLRCSSHLLHLAQRNNVVPLNISKPNPAPWEPITCILHSFSAKWDNLLPFSSKQN